MKIEHFDADFVHLILSAEEVALVSNCINEARSFVDDEFELRCGSTLEQAKELNNSLFKLSENMQERWEETNTNQNLKVGKIDEEHNI